MISRVTARSQNFGRKMEGNWDADLLCIFTVCIGMYFSCKSQQRVNILSWKQHFSAGFCFKYFEGRKVFQISFFPPSRKISYQSFMGPRENCMN